VTAADPAIVVIAKLPSGASKTRLASALDASARVALARAFLEDKVDQVRAVRGARAIVAFTPADPEAAAEMRALVGPDVELVAQRGRDLGERLANVAADVLAAGAPAVLLVDGDTPTLPVAFLDEAALTLRADAGADVVLGPAWDGGYWAIGLRRPRPELFAGIAWSTRAVFGQTVRAARAAGLRVHFLPAWFDVDTPADLDRLARELATTPAGRHGDPRRTRALLGALAGAPRPAARNERWQTLASRLTYQNPWMRLEENVVDLGDETLTLYGVITCGDCVGVVPLAGDGHVLLVRQFRYVARRDTWEIPTGGVHAGEPFEEAAQRELREETGHAAARLEHLSTFHTSKSIVDETAHIYLGEGLHPLPAPPDATERIETRAFAIPEALAMVEDGTIVDAMSVVGLLTAARRRGW